MFKIRNIVVLLFFFVIVGCGANIEYEYHIDTKKQTIDIIATAQVDESDYKEIKGGKEKLFTIINEYKPANYQFVNETNDIYTFKITFSSFNDYQVWYKDISGEDSSSVFEIQGFSKDSPFVSNSKITINDNLNGAFNWLKNALLENDLVDKENEDNIISSETTSYSFNEEEASAYNSTYEVKEYIILNDISTLLTLKKGNVIDLNITFLIEEQLNKNFSTNLSSNFKESKLDARITHENINKNDKKYIKYNISVNQYSLTKKNIKKFEKVFGKEFITLNYDTFKTDHFFSYDINQQYSITTDFSQLFNIDEEMNIKFKIEQNDMKLSLSSINKLPYSSKDNLSNIEFTTYYSILKINVILLVMLGCLLVIMIIIFSLKKKIITKSKIVGLADKIQRLIKLQIEKDIHDDLLIINGLIVENNMLIKIDTIDKVNLKFNPYIFKKLKLCLAILLPVSFIFSIQNLEIITLLVMIGMSIYIFFYISNSCSKVLCITLKSRIEIVFVFSSNFESEKNYLKLLDEIE